ncbi:ankyrin repeat domain-containing protein 40-like isoform 2-T2 [Macrochelys suwanniensis]
MTTFIEEKELQERLREAAALGDIGEVQRLVEFGVNVNSQNEINGWTCLHWACKRNHAQVVSYLIESGADKEILTSKGEMPAQLTSKREIRKTLGVEDNELADLKQDSDLPIVPNYLANPPFPYVYNTMCNSIPDPSTGSLNGNFPISLELQDVDYPTSAASQHENAASAVTDNEDMSASPGACTMPECPKPVVQNGLIHQASVPQSRSFPSPAASKQPVSQQQNDSCMGPMTTFQPFFFPGAFPFNMQELVLKVRIQNLTLRENDFIEIELDRQELTYKELLRDKDVARLQDFQELELVLIINDNNFLFRNAASTLTERPCYNKKASKLTY